LAHQNSIRATEYIFCHMSHRLAYGYVLKHTGRQHFPNPNRVSSEHRYSLKYAAGFWMAVLEGVVSSVIGAIMSRTS